MSVLDSKKSAWVPVTIITYTDVFLLRERYKNICDADYKGREARISLSVDDLNTLGIDDSSPVRLTNEFGSIRVQAKLDPQCPKGFGFMPLSQLSNRLTNYDPIRAKYPNLKRIEVIVAKDQL